MWKTNDMFRTTTKILHSLSITWTLLVHCNTGDTSVNVTTLKGLIVTDQWQWTPLVVGNSQRTDMDHTSHLQNDQHSRDHVSGQPTLESATSGPNASIDGDKVSMIPDVGHNTSFISEHSKCDPKKEAMLISMCPDTAEEADKIMCQSHETPPTVDTIFPVTDSVSGYHFRNVYCWRCFNQSGEPLTWSGKFAFTFQNRPDNYSSLSSYLRFIDDNPAFAIWEPPGQFSYPKCEDVDLFNCTVCVPKATKINGCSLVDRPQFRAGMYTYTCYACTSYEAKNSLDNIHLCENVHPEEVTFISWLNFFFLTGRRSDTLIIESPPGQHHARVDFTSQKCSIDLRTCSATACKHGYLLISGECDPVARWFTYRVVLCQFQTPEVDCFRQRPRNFLDKQFRDVKQPVNITANDIAEEHSCVSLYQQINSCLCDTLTHLEMNNSNFTTLKNILTNPVKQLILIYNQLDEYINLDINITEKSDFDTIEIEISGWERVWQTKVYDHLLSIMIQVMKAICMEGNHFLCLSYTYKIYNIYKGSSMECVVVMIFSRDIQENFSQENQVLTSDADRNNISRIIFGLGITLTRLMRR